MVFADEKMRSK